MYYSYFSESMGLARAARRVCQLMVNKAMASTLMLATMNSHQERDVRYAKFWSHLFRAYQAIGQATRLASRIPFNSSPDNKANRLATGAPNTLRMDISLNRLFTMKETNPNSPRQATKMARKVK